MSAQIGRDIHAVTFDCWGTLIYEDNPERTFEMRATAFFELLMEAGAEATFEEAVDAFNAAWQRHADCWARQIATGSPEVAKWALETFGIQDATAVRTLTRVLQETPTYHGVRTVKGAKQLLQALRQREIRRGLICDTGLVPSSVVRKLLTSVDLIEELNVTVFSDEVGVPKPNKRMFEAALYELKVRPEYTVHVGDLKRTDVVGARDLGIASIRIRSRYDDQSDFPEADFVIDTYDELREILGV
jgi:FMN phosphatase YigB (HAD superfamily)